MAYTAFYTNTNALYEPVTQVAHGFTTPGVVVRSTAPTFVAACADTEANAAVVGMISNIPDANHYFITQTGFVDGLTTTPVEGGTYVPNSVYYLSTAPASAGRLTAIKPTAVGAVELPCFIAYTATSGFFFANVGTLIESGSLFAWSDLTANQTLAVNQGYYVKGVGALNALLLPPACAKGDQIMIWDVLGNGFTITQGAGQSVIAGTLTTTVGVGGNIQSTAKGNLIIIQCETANTNFIANIAQTAGASVIVT